MPPNTPEPPLRYHTFILSLWAEAGTEPIWRCSLENPHTGERRGFQGFEGIPSFLEGWTRTAQEAKPMTE